MERGSGGVRVERQYVGNTRFYFWLLFTFSMGLIVP